MALQKLQEVLQMEPDNAQALSLKSKIENRRSEKQIENWYRLARQHIDNHAYPHAREALQNVLQLRPKEARALQLIAEVDRQEQEYNKLRQEKAQIHRAAMEAWQKGDVSSALTKLAVVLDLDRRAPDVSSPEHSGSYQSFYNEVRSEHDAMNTSYAEARKHLTDRNFNKALAICDTYLAKYPNNAIFQALKYDIEEQQRQELSAFVASVDRQVEAEPDLDKRVNILKEALDLHPGETHFERALRLVKDKRDLVNSIVARAHAREEQGSFSDALNDWEILRTIYSQYPGLKFEVERLQKRREQQTRIESKTHLVEQIDACLHSSDYARALDLLQKAASEFPNDAELGELEKLANDGVQRLAEAHRLMTEGQDLCAQDKFADGIKLLREAYELDENNTLTRAVFANALVEQARIVVESNWQEAEQLAQQALELNPGHPLAKTIRTLILDQKREQIVGECLSQARKLQAAGDLAGALSRIEEGLAAYPREPRLIQIQETVQRELQSQRRQMRRRDFEELRRMEREAETITDPKVKQVFGERVQVLAEKYVDDEELLPVANALLERLNTAAVQGKSASQVGAGQERGAGGKTPVPAAEGGATMSVYSPATMDAPASSIESPGTFRPSPDATAALTASTTSQAKSPASGAKPSARPFGAGLSLPSFASLKGIVQTARAKVIAASVAGAVLVLAFALFLVGHIHRPSAAPLVAKLTVQIHTMPPGATVRINNEVRGVSDFQVELREGNYQVEAQLDGYATKTSSLEAKPGSPNSLELVLEPAPPLVKLSSDTGTGNVAFDDQPPVKLDGAQWTLDKISPGEHKLKFDGPQGGASFAFSADAAALPVLNGGIVTKGVLAVIVGSMGSRLRIYCSDPGAKVSLDGQAPADVSQDGLELLQVSPGTHELALTHGNDQYKLDVDIGPVPTLATFLESGQNIGTLVVVTGEDKVRVFLNGQLQPDTTKGGQLRIPNLEPKDYVVKVAKSGFQELPEQKLRIRKGEQSKLVFSLQPIPHLASLSIQGGPAGAQVLVDQAALGTVQPDGTFSIATVNPGDHVVELRKEHFKPKRLQKHFVAGVNVALTAADTTLEAATGEVRITFSPPDATVNLTKAGEAPIKVTSGSVLNLPPGSYILTAKTAENLTRTTTVEVAAGQSKSLDLPLAPNGMSKWDDPAGWKPDKNSFVHKGGDFVLYSASPASGTFTFSAMLLKGHRLQWVLNYADANNYVLFQMDENNFYRTVVHNGQKSDEFRVSHKTDKKSFRTMQIHVTPSEIVHQVREGDAWVVWDKWSAAGTNLSSGKFGFYIPGNDQVALSNFSHYADLSIQH